MWGGNTFQYESGASSGATAISAGESVVNLIIGNGTVDNNYYYGVGNAGKGFLAPLLDYTESGLGKTIRVYGGVQLGGTNSGKMQIYDDSANNTLKIQTLDNNRSLTLDANGTGKVIMSANNSEIARASASGFRIGDGSGDNAPILKVLSKTQSVSFAFTAGGNATIDQTVTVSGAAVGDVVSLGIPTGAITGIISYYAWVSAADTVTIRASLRTSATSTLSGTFRVMVTKF